MVVEFAFTVGWAFVVIVFLWDLWSGWLLLAYLRFNWCLLFGCLLLRLVVIFVCFGFSCASLWCWLVDYFCLGTINIRVCCFGCFRFWIIFVWCCCLQLIELFVIVSLSWWLIVLCTLAFWFVVCFIKVCLLIVFYLLAWFGGCLCACGGC